VTRTADTGDLSAQVDGLSAQVGHVRVMSR
jgi:hypothetical protein